MRLRLVCVTAVLGCCVLAGCNKQNGEPMHVVQKDNSVYACDSDDMECEYEIEKAFRDNDFYNIIEGKDIPVEILYGIGGEGGYEQYSTKDPEKINEYIEAFREVKIKQVITNQEDKIVIFDGIEDYSFIMEDGTKIVLGTYCSTYVIDGEIEYVLENGEKLFELNKMIKEINRFSGNVD